MIMPVADPGIDWTPLGWFIIGLALWHLTRVIIDTVFGGRNETRD